MSLITALNRRYATKAFDATKKLPEDIVAQLFALLRLSPSSTNIQPWHFIVASSDERQQNTQCIACCVVLCTHAD